MKKILVLIIVVGLMLGFSAKFVWAQDYAPKVKEAMKLLKDKLNALGTPSLQGGFLYFGTIDMNGNFDIVDEIEDAMGCTATVFMKKGDGFVRISTNVMKEGHRAIGTKLAEDSPAMASIKIGEAYYGPADILGFKYETGYEPIKNAAGEIIGVYYVGYKL
ncbi:MAG: Cache 3/Cache 2 fusion domain-containing protein [Candidatus Omnitrophica bacterium]|nr:Cache 3/Cache 2 fusion domain-containing protein [Candidatus Omnitrophota bacterium]